MLSGNSWTVVAESDECVLVKISENVNLENLELILKDDRRILVTKMKIINREFRICAETGKPMFAEIGESVKYVSGSGSKAYLNIR